MADDNSQEDFKVTDRRIKMEEEEEKAERAEKSGKTEAKEDKAPERESAKDKAPSPEGRAGEPPLPHEARKVVRPQGEDDLPPVSFPTFLLSLHTSALINLGILPDPGTNQKVINKPLARQNIDLLELIKNKTKGNLNGEEQQLLDNILYELRMTFVNTSEQ